MGHGRWVSPVAQVARLPSVRGRRDSSPHAVRFERSVRIERTLGYAGLLEPLASGVGAARLDVRPGCFDTRSLLGRHQGWSGRCSVLVASSEPLVRSDTPRRLRTRDGHVFIVALLVVQLRLQPLRTEASTRAKGQV